MAQPEVIKDIEARVKKSGDTMTGSLTVNHSWPTINLLDPNNSKAIFQVNPEANNVYLGMSNSGIIVGPSDLKYLDSNSVYQNIYHTGNKPTPAEIGAYSKTEINTLLAEKIPYNGETIDPIDFNSIPLNTIRSVSFDPGIDQTNYHTPLGSSTSVTWYIVETYGIANRGVQIASLPFSHNRKIYIRYKHDNTWSSWSQLATTDDAVSKSGDTMTGALKFSGSNGIQTRHIDGESTTFGGDLYLNYGVNAPIHVGNGGSYTISADGSYYSGISNNSKNLLAFKTSSEPNNNPKYKLILTKKITAWTNHRATFATSSRHTGNGILSIAFGCDNGTVSDSTVYGQITYFGNSNYGAVWNNDRFILYYNNTNQEFYLFCYYYDYGPTTLTLLNSYTSGSGGQIVYDNLVDGVYVDSFNGYGIQVCQSKRGWVEGDLVTGAVWNDYAEYRESDITQPGRCIIENGDDTLSLSTERLQRGAEIVSDTFGFAIGETDTCKTPIAASGRVLAYGYEDREQFKSHIGYPVCSGPNGTVSIMTDEEEQLYPSRIIGYISAVPDYEIWGTGNVKVDGRIWIRIK